MRSLPPNFRAVVLGSTGGLGSAFVQALQQRPGCMVLGFSRPQLLLEDEAAIAACAAHAKQWLEGTPGLDLLIDATGALTIDGRGPEKRLDAINSEGLARSFQVNAIGRALVLKHFLPLLPRSQRSLVGVLSARVGSIEDNHAGGWYAYRASKAAGNQLLQSAAIEVARTRPQAVLLALQPGTVRTSLSAAFSAGHETFSPEESAERLLAVLDAAQPTGRAQFRDHSNATIPW